MAALCTRADVEALIGYDLTDQAARVDTLIEMASDVVAGATVALPTETPGVVRVVTAQLVVRQIANPTAAANERVGAWAVGYGAGGMQLTEDDYALLGPWALPTYAAYSVWTPSPFAVDDVGDSWVFDFSADDYPMPIARAEELR